MKGKNYHPTVWEVYRHELIWDMRLYGCTYAEIAKYFKVSKQTVQYIHHKLMRRKRYELA